MKYLIICFLFVEPSVFAKEQPKAQAGDKPVAADSAKKEAPAEAVIDAETMKAVREKAEAADVSAVRLEKLQLKLQLAQKELVELQKAADVAKSEANAVFQRGAIKAGIPGDAIPQYSGELQKDGSLKLVRKPAPPK